MSTLKHTHCEAEAEATKSPGVPAVVSLSAAVGLPTTAVHASLELSSSVSLIELNMTTKAMVFGSYSYRSDTRLIKLMNERNDSTAAVVVDLIDDMLSRDRFFVVANYSSTSSVTYKKFDDETFSTTA